MEKFYLYLKLHRNSVSEPGLEHMFLNSAQSMRTRWPPGKQLHVTISPILPLKREIISYLLLCYNLVVNSVAYVEGKKEIHWNYLFLLALMHMWERQVRFISSDEELDKWCYMQTSFYWAGFTVFNLDLKNCSRSCYIILCVWVLVRSFTAIKYLCHIHLHFSNSEDRKAKQTQRETSFLMLVSTLSFPWPCVYLTSY